MVSDMMYYCRIKGTENWEAVTDHPARPVEGIVSLWAKGKSLEDKSLIEFKRSETGQVTEVEYKK